MRTMLKLQHHRHTAKRLPHEHTSYRGLAVIAVVFALSLTVIQRATAATLDVSASNPAPIPVSAPGITSHSTGNVVNDDSVTISGTCEILTPAYSVTVYNNNQFVGSTPCASDGTFSVVIMVAQGDNAITVGSRTITNGTGPTSQPLILRYGIDEPPTPTPASEPEASPEEEQPEATPEPAPRRTLRSNSPASSSAIPKITFGESTYIVYTPNQVVELNYEVSDGSAPYRVSINWGDGTPTEESTVDKSGKYTATHSYQVAGTYTTTVSLIDNNEQPAQTSIAALTFARPELVVSSTTTPTSASLTANLISDKLFTYAWTAYGVIALSIVSFWFHGIHFAGVTPAPVRVRAIPHGKIRR